MARLGRFERPTSGSGDQRSIQLSYRRAVGAPRCFVSALRAVIKFNATILSGIIRGR